MHENRETSRTPAVKPGSRPAGEGKSHTARMHVPEESHSGILPMNQSNKDGKPSAENEEERPLIKENAAQPNTHPTQSGEGVSQGLAGVRKVARDNKEVKFTALLHHLTVDLPRESFYSLKRKAAPGVDGVTGSGRITYEGDPGSAGEYLLASQSGDLEVSIPASALVEIRSRSINGE